MLHQSTTGRLLTILTLFGALATTACDPWWHHDRGDDRGERRGPYVGGGGGYGVGH